MAILIDDIRRLKNSSPQTSFEDGNEAESFGVFDELPGALFGLESIKSRYDGVLIGPWLSGAESYTWQGFQMQWNQVVVTTDVPASSPLILPAHDTERKSLAIDTTTAITPVINPVTPSWRPWPYHYLFFALPLLIHVAQFAALEMIFRQWAYVFDDDSKALYFAWYETRINQIRVIRPWQHSGRKPRPHQQAHGDIQLAHRVGERGVDNVPKTVHAPRLL
ncbi:hypothetical protein MMC24_005230 [Lignoscripta atroalba]|nr:hypothetical protein [Lignoscripta atroalba]